MLTWILRSIISEEYRNIHDWGGFLKGPNTKGLFLHFSLAPSYDVVNDVRDQKLHDVDGYYPCLEILIYGEMNGIGVYTRTYDVHGRLKEKPFWEKVWSHHTSCWTEDGVGRIIHQFSDDLCTVGELSKPWREVVEISDDEREKLRALRKEKRG